MNWGMSWAAGDYPRPAQRPLTAAHAAFFQREKGYIAHPIPTPIKRKRKSDHTMYFTRSTVRRRLRKPNAMEISEAKSSMDCRWLSLNPVPAFMLCVLALLHKHAAPPADSARPPLRESASRNRLPSARHLLRPLPSTLPPNRTLRCHHPPNTRLNTKHRSQLN